MLTIVGSSFRSYFFRLPFSRPPLLTPRRQCLFGSSSSFFFFPFSLRSFLLLSAFDVVCVCVCITLHALHMEENVFCRFFQFLTTSTFYFFQCQTKAVFFSYSTCVFIVYVDY